MKAVLLVLAAVQAAAASPPAAVPPLEVLQADEVEYDVSKDAGVARGSVVLRRGFVVLHADVASYQARTGEVEATGHVLLTEPGRAIAANAMHAVLDGALVARDVIAFLKDTPLDLSLCRTAEEARVAGRTSTTFSGSVLTTRTQDADRFEVERARVTLCDCGAGPPSWQIRASHATIVPGKSAFFRWPILYITPRFLFLDTPVPILVLPVASIPLSDRQTGLLFPELSVGGVRGSGLGISQPIFVTLGRSWDTTITPSYIFASTTAAATGPGIDLELRWAPVEGMRGQLKLSLLHPLSTKGWPGGVALPPGGNRLALSGFHDQRLSDATFFRAELGVIGDPLYLQHFTGDILLRGTEYRRSAVALTHRTDDLLFEADAVYLLAQANLDTGSTFRAPFGIFGTDLSTFHRLPSASATLLPVRLGGPLHLSGSVAFTRFAPLRGMTGDEGQNGIGPGERGWSAAAIDAGERDGRWTSPGPGGPGERLASNRAVLRAELRAPMLVGGVMGIEPWVGATGATYAFETGLAPEGDLRGTAGLLLSTQLARTFGQGTGRIRHVVEPRVEWRGGTGQWGRGLPNYAYDELDVALPARVVDASGNVVAQRTLSAIPGSFSQVQLSISNRLVAPAGNLSNTFLELTLGQDLDAASGHASETWARAALRLPRVSADAYARFRAFGAAVPAGTPPATLPSGLDTFTELGGSVVVSDARGDNVRAGFLALGAGGAPRLMAGIEPFFDPRPAAIGGVAQGSVGATVRWGGAILSHDAMFYGRDVATCGKTTPSAPHVFYQVSTLVWDSPCRCWRAGLRMILDECYSGPQLGLIVDFSSFGGNRPIAR